MAKKRDQNSEEEKKPYIIISAKIKDGVCEYSYEINSGPCEGDQVKGRKGINIVHEDLTTSFSELNVHLAILDDAFTEAGDDLSLADMARATNSFTVTGFKVSGTEDNESFSLIGEKWVKHGSIALESPKISKASAYPFYSELQESMEAARNEVLAYMNGKSAPKYEQTEMEFSGDIGEFNNPM